MSTWVRTNWYTYETDEANATHRAMDHSGSSIAPAHESSSIRSEPLTWTTIGTLASSAA